MLTFGWLHVLDHLIHVPNACSCLSSKFFCFCCCTQLSSEGSLLSSSDFVAGVGTFISGLPDLMDEIMKAPELTAAFIADFVADGFLSLAEVSGNT